MAALRSRFLDLPREIRDEIYVLLLRDKPLAFRRTNPVNEPNHGIKRHELVRMHKCLRPDISLVNRQINHEYLAISHENMWLELRSFLSEEQPFQLPQLASYTTLPLHVCNSIASLEVHVNYGISKSEMPLIYGLDQLVRDTPALRRLNIHVFLAAELLEAFCGSDVRVPTVAELFTNYPRTADPLKMIDTKMSIISHMFEQNPNYHWNNTAEAKVVGDMWLHDKNNIIFRALPSNGSYAWRGLDLTLESLGASWDDLWEECSKNPMPTGSPYVL